MRHVALALLAAGCSTLVTADRDARSLADAERAFAALSVRTDMKAAFLANFEQNGVLGPVPGIDLKQLHEASAKQPRTNEQDHRQRHLRDY